MYVTTTANWMQLENSKKLPNVFFACLAITNIHYDTFGELLKDILPVKIIGKASDAVVKTHYRWYDELVKSPYPSFQVCTDFDTDVIDMDNYDPSKEKNDNGEEEDANKEEDVQADNDDDGSDSVLDPQPNINFDIDIAKPEIEKGVGIDDNNSDNSALDAQPNINTCINPTKLKEVEKEVGVVMKLG